MFQISRNVKHFRRLCEWKYQRIWKYLDVLRSQLSWKMQWWWGWEDKDGSAINKYIRMEDAGRLKKAARLWIWRHKRGYNFNFLEKANETLSEKTCSQELEIIYFPAHLPTSRNSPTKRCRLIAIRMPRTVIPSQKQATTLALGRWPLSFCSSLSKLCSPALLYILSEWAMQIPSLAAMSLNASIPLSP